MRLGKIEKSILKMCKERHPVEKKHIWKADLYTDEIFVECYGWTPVTHYYYYGGRHWCLFNKYKIGLSKYYAAHAAVSRALRTLLAKGLIDAGGNYGEATSVKIYSKRVAEMMGREPDIPLTDAELDKVIVSVYGDKWSYRSQGQKSRKGRTIKCIRLTDAGLAYAEKISKR